MNKSFLALILLFSGFYSNSQSDMKEGFTMLENGNFEKAEHFFESVLKTEPENKTARLCYGRAVGLSGEPEKAIKLFSNLLTDYPNDFEVTINFNESHLWAQKYEEAKPLYVDLVKKNPNKFAAVLGYANTLSNLKEYKNALETINKALLIEPNNISAKTSRKYIRLGYANEYINSQDYTEGEKLLNEIFFDFPDDKDALINLANMYLIEKKVDSATSMYKKYATTFKDSIKALNGIALAAHIGEKDKTTLNIAQLSKSKVAKSNDDELKNQTHERYVQALIWNKKFTTAKREIDSLHKVHPNSNWVLALRATLGLYTGDANTSVKNFEAILTNDSTSFDGNLGKANALFASDRIIQAYQSAHNTLKFYKNQKDAIGLIKKLNLLHTPSLEQHAAHTFDNGSNLAYFTNTLLELPLSTKFRTSISYFYRTTENSISGNKADSHVMLAGLNFKFLPKTILKTIIGINNSRYDQDSYSQLVLDVKLMTQPYKLQNLNFGYQREVQNFNADLIERKIVQNHYGLDYNLGTNVNLGWYSQLMYTQQSDENVRNLLFTSLYYNLLRKPALKMGLNYQYITFKLQVPTIYFSPSQYSAFEIFADLRGKFCEKTTYIASAATGIQKVEQDPNSALFRAEAVLQHQFSKRFSANIYGKYSNIASATAAGFEFTEIGLKLKWLFRKKPLFFNSIAAR